MPPIYTSFLAPEKTQISNNFLTDIIAHPDDDGIRLIYADWLEDNGDSVRAEFIRLQIKLHNNKYKIDPNCIGSIGYSISRSYIPPPHLHSKGGALFTKPCHQCWLKEKKREIILAVQQPVWLWFGGNPNFGGSGSPHFERGFVHQLQISPKTWGKNCDLIRSECPTLKKVIFTKLIEPTYSLGDVNLFPSHYLSEFSASHKRTDLLLCEQRWQGLTFEYWRPTSD